jgi:uncharacterized protein YkwD
MNRIAHKLIVPAIMLFLILLTAFDRPHHTAPVADPGQARLAFELLNKIRQQPSDYYYLGFNSSFPVMQTQLVWNDTLARVAEQKAMDMATKKYFAHVDPKGNGINYYINAAGYTLNPDWLKNRKMNNFESIQAGAAGGEDAIKRLITDAGVPSLGHRRHLLGSGRFYDQLSDIGIGFVWADSADRYNCYVSVIIAMHDWK